jgi:Spy/CpxP family protein refolding chaperone
MKRLALAMAVVAMATPALAQPAPPPPPPAAGSGPMMGRGGHGRMAPWANLSPEGQTIMRDTMRQAMQDDQRQPLRAARDKISAIVAADRLDVAALRRAMDDERKLMDAQHARRQEMLIAALQKLSPADRKLFAQNAQAGRERMEQRMSRMHAGA